MIPTLRSIADLNAWRATLPAGRAADKPVPSLRSGQALSAVEGPCISVCGGTGCRALSSDAVLAALREELDKQGLAGKTEVTMTGCPGFCEQGPLLMVLPERILYTGVTPDDATEIVGTTIGQGAVVDRLLYQDPLTKQKILHEQDVPFYKEQTRVILKDNGRIDPTKIEDYVAAGGYSALAKVLSQMTPEGVIAEVKKSGLRGRGGAGYPAGLKWEQTRRATGDPKYVICNADEGDPGAFQDRGLIEGNPHAVLEGMLIGAYAIGASEGYVYIRNEYPLAVELIGLAIEQARAYGLLGQKILGSKLDFDIHIQLGAGAFVCGEETALIASIEGRVGEPRPRPPFPSESGLWGKPTNINNTKTWASAPHIIVNGADWYASLGTEKARGTTVFSLVGKINNTGLVEVPLGTPLRKLIFEIGGGVPRGKKFKAVQTGGPSGGCLPQSLLNLPLEYESLNAAGSMMGSGGMIVMDEDTCMVDMARYFLGFTKFESCGKCTACREGVLQMHSVLTDIVSGKGREGDIELLEELGNAVRDGSLCGLGKTAANPLLSTIRYFREEYEAHIHDKYCPAGQCKALTRARCITGCPAEVDSPAYLALVAQGRYAEGLAVHRQRNPFALICGRVCPAPCVQKCRRGDIDDPIAIRQIKRFMADKEYATPWAPEQLEGPKSERVAVVGAGPAGLTAALRLAQLGYKVTVFEKLPVPGGMMAVGIPEYRLPRAPLSAEIENIRQAGVEIRCNQELGRDFTTDSLLEGAGYQAVILTIGAHKSQQLSIAGEDKAGVIHGTDFLRQIALSKEGGNGQGSAFDVAGKRVAVVGGGDVAVDAARSAWRLGANEVHLIYRRERHDMPALPEEITAATAEGIQFHFLAAPIAVLGAEHMTGIVVQRQRLGDFDDSGRRRPAPIEGDQQELSVDVLIPAIGQVPDLSWLMDAGIELSPPTEIINRAGTLKVDSAFSTPRKGVFAAGDAVIGPSTVIEAVAQGNLVAVSVAHWLKTGELVKPHFVTPRVDVAQIYDVEKYVDARQPAAPELSVAQRRGNFAEVELTFDEWTAREEARRCLRCDLEWLDYMGLPKPEAEREATQAVKGGR